MGDPLSAFREIWFVDFEFHQPPGETPSPICLVGREFRSKRTVRLWESDFGTVPPYPLTEDSLFVAYFASAEIGCHLAQGWGVPARSLDLYAEFRVLTNGRATICGNGLLGAMAYHGLESVAAAEKTEMRDLAIRGGPFTDTERLALLDYCESDVRALDQLLTAMLPRIDLPRALLRARYMNAVAYMERCGVPIDLESRRRLDEDWDDIKTDLTHEIDKDFGVFVPSGVSLTSGVETTAATYGVDAYALNDVSHDMLAERMSSVAETLPAIRMARMRTGLTTNRIAAWENSGKDHSTYPALDVTARSLASEYPELGIGGGYGVQDDADHAAELWELLSKPTPTKPRRAELLEDAAAVVADSGDIRHGGPLSFNTKRFAAWLVGQNIPWPRTATGRLSLEDKTFKEMARSYPQVSPLRELLHSLGEMRLFSNLTVGADGRNRCLLSPFGTKTGRNAPSSAKFIFGPSCWLRGLVKPEPGRSIAYVDWSQQEFGIAAALSSDGAMLEAYASGDPYLTFAKQANAVPTSATKETHAREREQFKVCTLAVQYGMAEESLAIKLGQPEAVARRLLRLHRETYPVFWKWSDSAVNHALLLNWLPTVFGWRVQLGQKVNPRSLANFPMQANGAEMLRLACCLATERGIRVCAPVHDALLVQGDTNEIDDVVDATQQAMAEASREVLAGFELLSDAKVVSYPDRYMDERGERMWRAVSEIQTKLTRAREVEAVEF